MDPISAFGLASGVLQTLSFSLDLIKTYQEISDEGSSSTLRDLETDTSQIQQCTRALKKQLASSRSLDPVTTVESELISATERCVDISDSLAAELAKINLCPQASKRRKIIGAAKAIWLKPNLQSIHRKLQDCQNTLQLHILCDLSFRQQAIDIEKSECMNSIDGHIQNLVTRVAAGNSQLQSLIIEESKDTRRAIISGFERSLKELRQEQAQRDLRIGSEARERELPDHLSGQVHGLLESLRFPSMMQRQNEIVESHSQTFEWIFDDKKQNPWSSFSEWLKSGTPMYWINGKAGSGKSTLMKFIMQHAKARNLLSQWAEPLEPCVLQHFFWSSGHKLQKSLKGLMSTLLYQVMAWNHAAGASAMLRVQQSLSTKRTIDDWSLKELKDCFKQVLDNLDIPVCIMLDGLDEFERAEGLRTLPNLLLDWSRRSRLKILISSRPEHHLQQAFHSCCQLRLQDLTAEDMRVVITDRLKAFSIAGDISPSMLDQLILATLNNAEGVFLWVHFALQSLERGLDGCDDWELLLKRIEKLPRGIDELYVHMWSRYNDDEELYRKETSLFFQIARDEHNGLPMSLGLFMAHVDEDLRDIFFKQRSALTWADLENRMTRCISRIRTRCAGLIEVAPHPDRRLLFKPGRWTVNYFHRTARDFLDEHEEGKNITGQVQKADAEMMIVRGQAVFVASIIDRWLNGPEGHMAGSEVDSLITSIAQSRLAEESQSDLLATIESVSQDYFVDPLRASRDVLTPRSDKNWYFRLYATNFDKFHYRALPDFIGFVASYGNKAFVSKYLTTVSDADLQPSLDRLLLYCCSFTMRESPPVPTFELVRHLLERGADPNREFFFLTKSFLKVTAWAKLLLCLVRSDRVYLTQNLDSCLSAVTAFLERGVIRSYKFVVPRLFEVGHLEPVSILRHRTILGTGSAVGVELDCAVLSGYVHDRLDCIRDGRPDPDLVPWIANSRILYFTSSDGTFVIPATAEKPLPVLQAFLKASSGRNQYAPDADFPRTAISNAQQVDLDALMEYLRKEGYLAPSTFVPLPIGVRPEEKAELEEYW